MDASPFGAFMRNRRFGSYFDASSGLNYAPQSKIAVKEEVEKKQKSALDGDDDGWFCVLISWIRIVVCFVTMMFTTFLWALVMLVLVPWPNQRIRQGNIYGHVTGRLLMWILGNPIKIEGAEYSDERAIYISNHASPIDIFLIMWLTPRGTVGIAKKEIIFYPLFGQLYVLANHLRIDRSNSGTHRAWRKGSLHVRPTPITVKYLPPIRTDDWTADKIEDYVKMVHNVYTKNLPECQKPQH